MESQLKEVNKFLPFLLPFFFLISLTYPLLLSGAEKEKLISEEQHKKKEEYTYNPKGKVDPFKPSITLDILKGKLKLKGPVLPLQTYELSQLKVVAIMLGFEHSRALLEDASGKGYIVKEGTYVGKNNGRIVKILPNKLIVAEEFLDHYGRVKTKKVAINLHQKAER